MAAFASRSYVWMHLLSDDHLLQDGRSGSGKKKISCPCGQLTLSIIQIIFYFKIDYK